ncbi:unnamed protein product (macronuclear) [Paramecium tetraurelia]|uniref:B box-type domain-containing protein n=1 Tax=Paramecium tetraurelia TaxID=5888 RepID=A0BNS8_PARTE|nr:uncharacterized protein GSPATT00030834001 [Paramecium tetraurelia]CAK60195.1 unnamed protein product [Paramecium tetraurelia]|eukprot:XP_001427593.1 hypothetical protein (macronuclear) [Paramecium tetraurelia strain d4-2]
MNQNQRKFVRCFNCQIKPATIKCFDCNENEPTKLCYHCDSTLHPDQDHQKQIIPYDQMVSNEERTHSITPEKQQDVTPHLSSILRSRIRKNEENTNFTNNEEILNKNQLKSVELKFRIKFQEQENTINLLKQHIENIESKHKENLSKMRDQLIKAQDEALKKQEETANELIKVKKQYEDKIAQYVSQIESETQFNNSLQTKLDELRNTHQIKQQESQQIIAQLRAEIERRKFQEEQIRIEAENQVIQIKKESQQEIEKSISLLKNDCSTQVEEYKQKLTGKQEQVVSLQSQIQQLQGTLKDIEGVWQKKLQFEQQQYDELRQKYNQQGEECEILLKDVRNLQSEIMIYQKENELFQKEKLGLTKQLNQQLEKNEKMDRFIYGSRKSQIKIKI